MTVKIILEAGVNHNGSLKRAKKMIDLASKAGADFIKFQSFLSDDLVTEKAKNFPYEWEVAERIRNFVKKFR